MVTYEQFVRLQDLIRYAQQSVESEWANRLTDEEWVEVDELDESNTSSLTPLQVEARYISVAQVAVFTEILSTKILKYSFQGDLSVALALSELAVCLEKPFTPSPAYQEVFSFIKSMMD